MSASSSLSSTESSQTSTSTSLTSSAAQATDTNDTSSSSGSPSSSASLYLYTFLATLLLLLGVSAAIVLRSLVLRRRHRRMIEEAIANGTWVPSPTLLTSFPTAAMEKPVMYDVYLKAEKDSELGGKEWSTIMPMSASYTRAPPQPLSLPPPVSAPSLPSHRPFFSFRRHRPPAPLQPEPPQYEQPQLQPSSVALSMLIAMPHEDEHEDIPVVEVGVAVLPLYPTDTGDVGKGSDDH